VIATIVAFRAVVRSYFENMMVHYTDENGNAVTVKVTPTDNLGAIANAIADSLYEILTGIKVVAPDSTNDPYNEAVTEMVVGLVNVVQTALNAHTANTSNPHLTTAAQTGAEVLGTRFFSDDYGGVTPPFTPTVVPAFAIDTSVTPRVSWIYDGISWTQIPLLGGVPPLEI
jgi:hypothetical protein